MLKLISKSYPVWQARSQGGGFRAEAPPERFGKYMGEKEEEEEISSFSPPPNQNPGYVTDT